MNFLRYSQTVAFFIIVSHTARHVDQANIPAEKAKAIEDARIPYPLQKHERCFGSHKASPQRPRKADRLGVSGLTPYA